LFGKTVYETCTTLRKYKHCTFITDINCASFDGEWISKEDLKPIYLKCGGVELLVTQVNIIVQVLGWFQGHLAHVDTILEKWLDSR